MRLPLCSSELVVKILERDGFAPTNLSSKGSHRTFRKHLPKEDRTLTTVVVLARKEIPRGTLESILKQAEMTEARFLRLHRKCR